VSGPELGATPSSRRGAEIDATGVHPDASSGHNLEAIACHPGEHDWITTSDSVDRRPFLRPAPLVCQLCELRLQTVALDLGQEVDP
jgi:hypothetical protein